MSADRGKLPINQPCAMSLGDQDGFGGGALHQLEARAIAMAYELHRVLGEICDLPGHGLGSCTEQAWDLMDDVIWYLDPDAPDEGARQPRRLGAAETLS